MSSLHQLFKKLRSMRLNALAVIMSVTILIMSLPMGIFATMVDFGSDSDSVAGNIIPYTYELEERREESVKHFKNPDGTVTAVQFDMPVHRQNEEGEWKEIDNTLYSSANEYSTSDARIKFAKKTTGNEVIFTLHDGNGKITFSLDGANKKINGEITNYETDENADDITKLSHLNKLNSSILYKGILENVDLEYITISNSIKENIIVNSPLSSYVFTFTMKLNNFTAEMTEDGSILVMREDGEVVYNIAIPYMYDANGEISDQVSYTLTKSGNKEYKITVTADSEWINSPERAFPVTIDPSVLPDGGTVTDLQMPINSPNANNSTATTLKAGGDYRLYWKNSVLPDIPDHAYISSITFSLYQTNTVVNYLGIHRVTADWTSTLVYNNTISSSSPKGTIETEFLDHQETSTGSTWYTWNITELGKNWYDGTYANYGICVQTVSGTSSSTYSQFYASECATVSLRPRLMVTYSDQLGLEDYWTYTTQDVGFAGTGYINNATGNLVFVIPTLTTTDALMPITPSLVYNFCLDFAEYKYPNVQSANTASISPRSTKLNLNETLIKKAFTGASGSTVYYFIWADGDGTEHYFIPTGESNTYADEDGLLLTLKESTSSCTVTDSNKNVRTFTKRTAPSGVTSAWYLSSIADKNGNKVTFTVDSSYRPTTVSLVPKGLSAIEQLKIAYNSAGSPYAIWNPTSGEGVVFRYSNTYSGSLGTSYGGYLRRTIRAHGGTTEAQWLAFYNTNDVVSTSTITVDAVAEYGYNYLGLMSKVTNTLSQYKVTYSTYESKKISAAKESSSLTGEAGQKVNFTYGTSSTVIRSGGTDDVCGNSDDLLTTYCFDQNGRTISSYTTDLNQTQVLDASYGQYVGNDNEKAKNNLKSSVQGKQLSSNFLLNGGFEYGSGTTLSYWTKTGSVTNNTGIIYEGHSAAQLSLSSSTSTSSIYQYVYLDKGDYSLSLYINTHDLPKDVNVYLKAESTTNSAHSVTKEIPINEYYATGSYAFDSLSFSSSPSTSGGRERFKISVVMTGSVTSSKEVYVDNIMLSRTTGASEFDLSLAGHFENTGSYAPSNFWSILEYPSKSISVVDSGSDLFGDVLRIGGDIGQYEFVQQVMYQATDEMKSSYPYYSENSPMLFTVSGWGKGTFQSYSDTSLFGIRVEIKYYNGTAYGTTETYDFAFDKGMTDWQFVSGGFATNPDKGIVDSITVMIMYNDHAGDGYFDNISLVRDSYTTGFYDYNANGYLSSYRNNKVTSWYRYDDNDNLICAVSSDKNVVLYTYDSQNRVTEEYYGRYSGTLPPTTDITVDDITGKYYSFYEYNAYGQVKSTSTRDMSDTTKHIYSNTEYNVASGSHIFGTVATETDSLGNTTRYYYNSGNGRLLAVIYPDGTGVCYQYDGMGNLTAALQAEINSTQTGYTSVSGANVSYGYDSTTKRLSTITTHPTSSTSTTYSFSYDNFGNTSSISAGSRTLASYSYNSENGKLNTLTYGNGLTVEYVYDILDRISEIKYNDVTTYSYTYDTSGNLFSVTDHANGEVTLYNYDSHGKLMNSYVYDSETYLNEYGTTVYYDDESRVSIVFHAFDYLSASGVMYDHTNYSYTYNDTTGNIERLRVSGSYISGTIDPVYDNFGRPSTKTIDFNINGSDAFYNKLTYDYKTYGTRESALVSQIVSEIRKGAETGVLSTTTSNYTYDANGNITQITNASGVIQYQYTYDDLGQLIREDNRPLNKSYVYAYDNAGNITSKKTYAFTTGTLGTVQETFNYTYGDSTWRDLLTNFNGTAITYDAIGNPTKIGSKTLTWKGRQLTSQNNGSGQTLTYGYNADGIRTYKQVYNSSAGTTTRHEYILNGSQIIKETVFVNNTESYTLAYLYDETGAPLGYRYRTPSYASGVFDGYFFERNLQGDIIAVYNQSGTKVASYTYDVWGKITETYSSSSTAVKANPFRYRGYYYDTETGFYYLQSRYYNPEWGRFISADGYVSTGHGLLGHNMFAYCFNNPLMLYDPAGDFPWAIIAKVVVTAIVVAIVALVTYEVITSESNDQTFATEDDALNDWANKYGPQSQDRERGAIVYQITDKEGTISYTYGRTYNGFSNNTIPGFVIGYISGGTSALLDPNKKMIGFIHSHPDVAAGYHNDFPSNPDLFLLNLPGISEVYVVPYTKCSGVPSIIAGSQKSTWIH